MIFALRDKFPDRTHILGEAGYESAARRTGTSISSFVGEVILLLSEGQPHLRVIFQFKQPPARWTSAICIRSKYWIVNEAWEARRGTFFCWISCTRANQYGESNILCECWCCRSVSSFRRWLPNDTRPLVLEKEKGRNPLMRCVVIFSVDIGARRWYAFAPVRRQRSAFHCKLADRNERGALQISGKE